MGNIYSIIYCIIRISTPVGALLDSDKVESDLAFVEKEGNLILWMPLLNAIMVMICFGQLVFYLKVFKGLNRWFKLAAKGFFDAGGFLIVFAFFLILFTTVFYVLGTRFDDMGNYVLENNEELGLSEYDTNFNEYLMMP